MHPAHHTCDCRYRYRHSFVAPKVALVQEDMGDVMMAVDDEPSHVPDRSIAGVHGLTPAYLYLARRNPVVDDRLRADGVSPSSERAHPHPTDASPAQPEVGPREHMVRPKAPLIGISGQKAGLLGLFQLLKPRLFAGELDSSPPLGDEFDRDKPPDSGSPVRLYHEVGYKARHGIDDKTAQVSANRPVAEPDL